VFPGESEAQTLSTLRQVAGDPGIQVSLLEPVQPAPETVPDSKVMAAITQVVDSMWPGVPVLPVMAAGASDSIFTRAAVSERNEAASDHRWPCKQRVNADPGRTHYYQR
jgi:acetylornithine deacetylase/succinyl-diaminopimelate desuccinylase-like protein